MVFLHSAAPAGEARTTAKKDCPQSTYFGHRRPIGAALPTVGLVERPSFQPRSLNLPLPGRSGPSLFRCPCRKGVERFGQGLHR
jgi:hypothetical protein